MKLAEGTGALIGAFVDGIAAGVAVYYSGRILCCLIIPAGYLAGSRIGRAVE